MAEQNGAALVQLTLTEIAERIHRHLKRLEAEQERQRSALSYEERQRGLRRFYGAHAAQSGNRVSVGYKSYQGGSKLTREQALHYLAALDRGYERTHFELFQKDPPPRPGEPDILVVALVRASFGDWALYGVTKRTETRVYGRRIAGGGYVASFLPRSAVLKYQATEYDLARVQAAQKKRAEAVAAADAEYRATIAAMKDPGFEEESDATGVKSGVNGAEQPGGEG